MKVFADIVYCGGGRVLEPGLVVVSDNLIVDVREAKTGDGADVLLRGCALFPGLVNAHAHMDYTLFQEAFLPTKSFTAWLSMMNQTKRHTSESEIAEGIRKGIAMAIRSGTTSLVNICAYPHLVPAVEEGPRCWQVLEATDVNRSFVFPDLENFQGVSPHAPYTASTELYRRSKRTALQRGLLFTTHVNESNEEMEMFTLGTGELYEMMLGLGRDMSDCGYASGLALLLEEGLLPQGSLLAHVNFCESWEMAKLRDECHTVVHCPSCHKFFSRSKFSAKQYLRAGVNLALGTDSAATGSSLSMIEEMRIFSELQPDFSMAEIFLLATEHGARALGLQHNIGKIAPEYFASLFAVPHEGRAPLHALFAHRGEVRWVMVEGRVVYGGEP